jgi:hypothetical protein
MRSQTWFEPRRACPTTSPLTIHAPFDHIFWQVATLVRAVDSEADVSSVMALADVNESGSLDLDELRHALTRQTLFRMQSGRWLVALSLAEAESLRALIHTSIGQPLLADHPAATVALRVSGGPLLDVSEGYMRPPREQELSADAVRLQRLPIQLPPPKTSTPSAYLCPFTT